MLAAGIEGAAAEEEARTDRDVRRKIDRRAGIEGPQSDRQRGRIRACDIGFGDDEPVGDCGLAARFLVPVERPHAVHGIDGGDEAVECEGAGRVRIGHERVEDRRRLGQPGRLDDNLAKRCDVAAGAAAAQVVQGFQEIAARGAAQAAIADEDRLLARALDQEMVDADGAELVDDDGGFRKRRQLEEPVEEGGLAAAEKPGEDGDGDAVRLIRGKLHRARGQDRPAPCWKCKRSITAAVMARAPSRRHFSST